MNNQISTTETNQTKGALWCAITEEAAQKLIWNEINEACRLFYEKAQEWRPGQTDMWFATINGKELGGFLEQTGGPDGNKELILFLAGEHRKKSATTATRN